jgi:hypothetical protein
MQDAVKEIWRVRLNSLLPRPDEPNRRQKNTGGENENRSAERAAEEGFEK